MLHFEHDIDGTVFVYDGETQEKIFVFNMDDFIFMVELLDLEAKGYVSVILREALQAPTSLATCDN